MPIFSPRHLAILRALVLQQTPVIVYSAERTGTVGMLKSLEASGVHSIATHYLTPASAAAGRMSRTARWASQAVIQKRKPVHFITLIRNPIEAMLSSFAKSHVEQINASDSIDKLFAAAWLNNNQYHHQINWLKDELAAALSIDPYAQPFDKTTGIGQLSNGPFRLLILRTNLDEIAKSKAVNQFLGINHFKMLAKETVYGEQARLDPNRPGSTAHHGSRYDALRNNPPIPKPILQEITASAYVRHFFNEDEIAAMQQHRCEHAASATHH